MVTKRNSKAASKAAKTTRKTAKSKPTKAAAPRKAA
jgi:hypothetical protein